MDNFMDKLAKRFNAGEIIRANAQAEARDMKRLQERTAEYEMMMKEMRRLNLKNVEMTEQVQQLIQCGIEQFEGYGSGEVVVGQKLDLIQDQLACVKDSSNNTEAVEVLISDVAATVEKMNGSILNVENSLGTVKDDINGTANQIDLVKDDVVGVKTDLSGVKTDVSGVKIDISGVKTDIADVKSDVVSVSGGINTMQYQLAGLENNVRAMEQNIMEELGKGIDAETLAPILNDIHTLSETIQAMQASLLEGNKKLEEYVHKENVRVYRNVQASVVDETSKKATEIYTRLDRIEASVKKNGGVKAFAVLAMLAALASVALQVVQMLGLL